VGKEDVVEEIVVDLNTDVNVTIILGNYAPLILAPAEDLLVFFAYYTPLSFLSSGRELLYVTLSSLYNLQPYCT
jgi:hypothetical protein